MGLLSSIKKATSKVGDVLGKALGTTFKATPAIFSHPIVAATKGLTAAETKLYGETGERALGAQAKDVVLAGATYATAAIAGLTTVGRAAVVKVASVVKAHPKASAVTALAAPVAISAAVKNPAKAAKAPSDFLNFQTNVGGILASETPKEAAAAAKETFVENPIISSAVIGGAALITAKAVIPAIATYSQTQAIQEQTKAIEGATSNLSASPATAAISPTAVAPSAAGALPAPTEQVIPQKQIITDAGAPITSATSTISTKKRHRKVKVKEKPSVRQNVNVVLQSRNTSTGLRIERYLNNRVFA